MKYVKYNGETRSYYGCSTHYNLVVGRTYKVIRENVGRCQTDYYLEGVKGYYNSTWFDDLPSYLALGTEVPEVGKPLDVVREEIEGGQVAFKHYYTTQVTAVERLSANTYLAVTFNTVYIVQVLS